MRRRKFGTIFLGILLAGCAKPENPPTIEEILHDALNTVEERSKPVLEKGKQKAEETGEEFRKPVNAAEGTNKNVKSREQMMEDAGGKMIDEMR